MASTFYVYGEDGLTLKYLKESLGEILQGLDGSDPEDCTVYFRPSFGRTGLYGEFDAIIITPDYVYPVESKWDGSGDLSGGLRDIQIIRHAILRWYQKNWQGERGANWDKFAESHDTEFKKLFPRKYIPGSESKLSMNLQTILESIGDRKIEDVFLVFYENEALNVKQEGFKIIQIQYTPTNGLFLELT